LWLEYPSLTVKKRSRIPAALFVVAELFVLPAFAYETDLSESAVREAYFLGQRHDEKTSAFLAQYIKYLPKPKTGPHIAEIRLLTPLAQIVQVSQLATPGYNAPASPLGLSQPRRFDPLNNTDRVHTHLQPDPDGKISKPDPRRSVLAGFSS
jgi:hypothetical protein